MSKTTEVSWEDVESPALQASAGGDSKKTVYLRLPPGSAGNPNVYTVRPVAKVMAIYRYFKENKGKNRSVIVDDPESCPVRERHSELEPKLRYAINVIDRADGEIKVLEAPPSVFKGFKEWYKRTKKAPGGEKGGDFSISVELPQNGDKRQTKYSCMYLDPTPFTEDEIKRFQSGGLYNLNDVYKPNASKQIEEILFGDNPDEAYRTGTGSSSGESSKSESSKSEEKDDFFESDGDTGSDEKADGEAKFDPSWA